MGVPVSRQPCQQHTTKLWIFLIDEKWYLSVHLFFIFKTFFTFFIVIQVQLSPFPPTTPPPQTSPLPTFDPTPLWLCPCVLYTFNLHSSYYKWSLMSFCMFKSHFLWDIWSFFPLSIQSFVAVVAIYHWYILQTFSPGLSSVFWFS